MAGAGYKLFATGDVLTAAQVNTYLNEQTIMVFADSSARDTALTSVKSEGMFAFLLDPGDRLTYYDGSSWVVVDLAGDITGVTAGTLLDGGGTSGTVTLNVDLSEASTSTSDADGDYFLVTDAASAQYKLTKANIALSGMNNDSGWTANAGDITAVVAGTNIGGGATSGSATVNLSIDAAVACADQVVSAAKLQDYSETVEGAGSKSAAFDLDFEDGNVTTATFTSGTFNVGIVNALASHSNSMTLLLTNGGTATPSFLAGANGSGGNAVKWAGGTAPTLTTSGTDVLCFTTFDGGTNYYGFAGGLDFSAP